MASLSGKTALVTGSSSGIGHGMACRLAEAGADIVLHGIEPEDQVAERIQEVRALCHTKVAYFQADTSDPAAVRRLVAEATETFGKVDILVNNAGIQFTAKVQDFPDERWDSIIAINLSASFHGAKAVLPGMIERGYGRIINIASAHGLVASPEKSAYVAAKHGLVGLTKVIALETAGTGVTCNAICPGWVYTPLVAKQVEARAEQEGKPVEAVKAEFLAEKQPSGDFVTPEQLGGLSVFLCTDDAAQMTGTALSMDGGWVAR
ncbi:3-hydroxybutyrate dehydrogenase [Marinivivus vitaminiproducens]|uniref:3-hydroxybutyrate dehydrogenase n=1 Tax=Marinivivus vitaminiproducens TaxID=3035935 RepID=UPI00279E681C|nr:3-hydroxybutyrate dehydrogenase [Geminicoccaceae bacterium SCSIO 64248]